MENNLLLIAIIGLLIIVCSVMWAGLSVLHRANIKLIKIIKDQEAQIKFSEASDEAVIEMLDEAIAKFTTALKEKPETKHAPGRPRKVKLDDGSNILF